MLFKQMTAYDMRISDWSSYVCSSDLGGLGWGLVSVRGRETFRALMGNPSPPNPPLEGEGFQGGDGELGPVAGVDRDDPARQVAIVAAVEARRFHHRLQLVLRRMLADRLGQVLVAVGVLREQLAEPRQHLERVEVVQRPEPVRLEIGRAHV